LVHERWLKQDHENLTLIFPLCPISHFWGCVNKITFKETALQQATFLDCLELDWTAELNLHSVYGHRVLWHFKSRRTVVPNAESFPSLLIA
jgi:hypothetical protein